MIIETSPETPLSLNLETDADLAIDIEDLGLKYTDPENYNDI